MRVGLARVSGRSMEPTLRPGDPVVEEFAAFLAALDDLEFGGG